MVPSPKSRFGNAFLDLVISRLIPKFKLVEVELRAAVYKLYKLKADLLGQE